MMSRIHLALLVLLAAPGAVLAQAAPPPAPSPLVVEQVRTPFVFAPDYKVTEIDGDRRQMAGGFIGRAFDETLFVGAAGYWLVDGSPGEELGYGGLMLGWSVPRTSPVRVGVRGLIGGGTATLARDLTLLRAPRGPSGAPVTPTAFRVFERDDFFVFEPQVGVAAHVLPHVALNVAGGYRLTGLTRVLDDDRLNGATGSVALQFEW
jgi:hypothetical protein